MFHIHRYYILIAVSMLTVFPVSAAQGTEGLGYDSISTDCVIEPNELVEVSTPVSGVMDTLKVERGDTVKKGQVLATLNARVEKAAVELARARAERNQTLKAKRARSDFTRRRLERNRELYKQKLISAQVVDEAETDALLADLEFGEVLEDRSIAELELKRAQELLETRTIRSPLDGVVIDISVVPGESINNRPLLKIARIDPLNVEVIAPVQLFGKVKKGMTAKVFPEEPVGSQYTAKVVIVDRVIDAASGTFGIRLELPNKNYALPAGLRCQVDFPKLKSVAEKAIRPEKP